jgi:hypothetical protein
MSRDLPRTITAAAGAVILMLGFALPKAATARASVRPAPEFPTADPARWINSDPLSMKALRGSVVVLEVWTFG